MAVKMEREGENEGGKEGRTDGRTELGVVVTHILMAILPKHLVSDVLSM